MLTLKAGQQNRDSFRPEVRTLGCSPSLTTNGPVGLDKSLNLLLPMSLYVKTLKF